MYPEPLSLPLFDVEHAIELNCLGMKTIMIYAIGGVIRLSMATSLVRLRADKPPANINGFHATPDTGQKRPPQTLEGFALVSFFLAFDRSCEAQNKDRTDDRSLVPGHVPRSTTLVACCPVVGD